MEFPLNRLFLGLLGLTLLGLAVTKLVNDPERLLLGSPKTRRNPTDIRLTRRGDPLWSLALPWPVALTQLAAIIRYEFRLQWRSAALPAVVAGLAITPLLGAVVALGDFQGYRGAVAAGTMAADVLRGKITGAMVMPIWVGLSLMALIFIPPLAAETIPRDRQAGVRELLDALPLPPGLYLLGKLLSLWLSLIVAVTAAALTTGLIWWLIIGPFDLVLFLDLWFVGGLGLCLINAGFSLLLAAPQTTTRRAVLVGAAFSLLCLIGTGLLFAPQPGWWQWLNPARPAVMLHYMLGLPGVLNRNDDLTRAIAALVARIANRQAVFTALGTGLAQVGLIWLMMWQWLKRI
jgi:ABC-type transport system involved in multi-copper enzyme maturation permease subunit